MKELTYLEAINEALHEEMARDERVFAMGEDVAAGYMRGGIFGATRNLLERFGPERVYDTPISESGICGCAVGAALMGYRPIVELMFGDFLTLAMDQIVNLAAKMRWCLDGKSGVPIVYRTAYGAGVGAALHHSQSFEAWFAHVPGLKVVLPSTPADAKGLLKAAVRDEDPVIFFEHKYLYRSLKGPVPEEEYVIPIGKADVKRKGEDITIIATGAMVQLALEAADSLEKKGVQAEVVDPRTILPLDEETILESVKKTGKVVIVHEAPTTGGFGGEIAAIIADKGFDYLDGPIKRVGALFCPIPFSVPMEKFYLPSVEKILDAAKDLIEM
ncbi:MAG: alpha-ketoacid dehydrogenase subunit beta [Desulfobacterales bacterium]|nr:alpha-ketoacid dehydrogenase subunit beta [Desulfobacterales bacterium]